MFHALQKLRWWIGVSCKSRYLVPYISSLNVFAVLSKTDTVVIKAQVGFPYFWHYLVRFVLSFRKILPIIWPPEASFTVAYMCHLRRDAGQTPGCASCFLLAFLHCSCAFYKQPQTGWHFLKIYWFTNSYDIEFLSAKMLTLMLFKVQPGWNF